MPTISLNIPVAKEKLRLKNLVKMVLRKNRQGVDKELLIQGLLARFPHINEPLLRICIEELIADAKVNEQASGAPK